MKVLTFHDLKITAVLAGDRVETFQFNTRAEFEKAMSLWVVIPDAEKPELSSTQARSE